MEQIDVDWTLFEKKGGVPTEISDEKATLLYILDSYNKYLLETDAQPLRKVRETLDEFSKGIVQQEGDQLEKTLFRLRQFFSSHRIEEYTYIQKTFNDFKGIIWDFADQLGEDLKFERSKEKELKVHLDGLREAVEADAINDLRTTSREFIDSYIEYQTQKEERRSKRMNYVRKNLTTVKKQLVEANQTMRMDHLTGAHTRKSFEDQAQKSHTLFSMSRTPCSLLMLDIDHFKKINDTYGHHVGDSVLKNCVKVLKECFERSADIVARVGGEEFAILLPDLTLDQAAMLAQQCLDRVRAETMIQGNREIKFTISMGVSQLQENETVEDWVKRTDAALYVSKNSGRDRWSLAADFVPVAQAG